MQQPPSDRSNKNPYAMPSAWPRAPQQTFHLKVPKPPPGMAPAKAAAPPRRPPQPQAPARPTSTILTGSALPVGYVAPQHVPEIEPFEPVIETPPAAAEAPFEPFAEEAPPPAFVAPPEAPFVAPLRTSAPRRTSRAPLFIGAALAVTAGLAAAAWLLLREPETSTVIEPAQAPARAPVIVPPSFDYLMTEEEASGVDEPAFREPTQTAAAPAPVTRATPSETAVELPSGPVAYSGGATVVTPPRPVAVQPRPAPPPPAISAPAPPPPPADPDAPQTTRDPTSGN